MPFFILSPLNDFSFNKNEFFRKGVIRDLENIHHVGTF